MPKKPKKYNNFDEMEKNKQNKSKYNNFEINNINKKADNNFFDKVVISPLIIIKEFPQISSIVEEYKKSDKNSEKDLSLEKPLIQEIAPISSKIEE